MGRRRSYYPKQKKYSSRKSIKKSDINAILLFGLLGLCAYFWYISLPLAIILIILGIISLIARLSAKNKKVSHDSNHIGSGQTVKTIESNISKDTSKALLKPSPSVHSHDLNIDTMDGHDFEYFCAELLKKIGYKNVYVTPKSGDHGIDVVADKKKIRYAIQCKQYNGKVPNKAVQEAHSGMNFYNSKKPVVLTNSYFSKQAIQEARVLNVELWDRPVLLKMMKEAGISLVAPRIGSFQTKDFKPVAVSNQADNDKQSLYPAPKYDEQKGIYIEAFNQVGVDIPTGRYILNTKGYGSGRIEIYDSFEDYKDDKIKDMKVFQDEYRVVLPKNGMFIYIENTSLVRHSSY